METVPALFTSLKIRDIEIPNRIAVSPMCMYSSKDGFSNNWHLVHLGSRAVGGAGLVLTEATAVSPEGRISPDDLGIWKDAHITGLAEIVRFLKTQGAVPGIQLAHAGRKASTASPWKGKQLLLPEEGGWATVAPSGIPFFPDHPAPEVLDEPGIQKVISDFKKGAQRALEAGFEVLELHAAHGYLLHEFLSPVSNTRTDVYGGSFENRCRLLLEVIREVRSVWPEHLPLLVRISATDWVKGGWEADDSVRLAQRMKALGVDLVDCSSGGMVPEASIPVRQGYQVEFAQEIRTKASIATGAVGLITEAQHAEAILQGEEADLIFMGRELLRNPYFPMSAAKSLGAAITPPPQYERSW